jgi:hypothetical protein
VEVVEAGIIFAFEESVFKEVGIAGATITEGMEGATGTARGTFASSKFCTGLT